MNEAKSDPPCDACGGGVRGVSRSSRQKRQDLILIHEL
jgi:hypothetical protein